MTSTSRISKYMAVTEETNYTYFFLEVERSSAQDISKKCLEKHGPRISGSAGSQVWKECT